MADPKTMQRIVWAIDAYGEKAIQLKTAQALKKLAGSREVKIEPVYVLTADQVNVYPEYYPEWTKVYEVSALRMLQSISQESGLAQLQPPRVIVENKTSQRWAADALMRYAKSCKADLVAVSTHARHGISRFLLGSYAENLVLHSSTPLYIVSPQNDVVDEIKNILFPTDLTAASRKGFERVVNLAKELSAQITLYHKALTQVPIVLTSGLPLPYYESKADAAKKSKALAETWADWAGKQGASVKVIIDEVPGELIQSIEKAQTEGPCQMVAMVSQLGPVGAVLLGSYTRRYIRQAKCPVWVMHIE